jgi:hypothetical protein
MQTDQCPAADGVIDLTRAEVLRLVSLDAGVHPSLILGAAQVHRPRCRQRFTGSERPTKLYEGAPRCWRR